MISVEDSTVHRKANNNSACGFMLLENHPVHLLRLTAISINGELETS